MRLTPILLAVFCLYSTIDMCSSQTQFRLMGSNSMNGNPFANVVKNMAKVVTQTVKRVQQQAQKNVKKFQDSVLKVANTIRGVSSGGSSSGGSASGSLNGGFLTGRVSIQPGSGARPNTFNNCANRMVSIAGNGYFTATLNSITSTTVQKFATTSASVKYTLARFTFLIASVRTHVVNINVAFSSSAVSAAVTANTITTNIDGMLRIVGEIETIAKNNRVQGLNQIMKSVNNCKTNLRAFRQQVVKARLSFFSINRHVSQQVANSGVQGIFQLGNSINRCATGYTQVIRTESFSFTAFALDFYQATVSATRQLAVQNIINFYSSVSTTSSDTQLVVIENEMSQIEQTTQQVVTECTQTTSTGITTINAIVTSSVNYISTYALEVILKPFFSEIRIILRGINVLVEEEMDAVVKDCEAEIECSADASKSQSSESSGSSDSLSGSSGDSDSSDEESKESKESGSKKSKESGSKKSNKSKKSSGSSSEEGTCVKNEIDEGNEEGGKVVKAICSKMNSSPKAALCAGQNLPQITVELRNYHRGIGQCVKNYRGLIQSQFAGIRGLIQRGIAKNAGSMSSCVRSCDCKEESGSSEGSMEGSKAKSGSKGSKEESSKEKKDKHPLNTCLKDKVKDKEMKEVRKAIKDLTKEFRKGGKHIKQFRSCRTKRKEGFGKGLDKIKGKFSSCSGIKI